MDSVIEEIKQRIDIVELISGYLKLEKTGINYRAVCPFHSEKKPSFFVNPARQVWKCFGCFPAKTLIKTETGFNYIEDLKMGDKVLTHEARYMPIIRSLWRFYSGDMVKIKIRKSSEEISLTGDHKVFAIKTKTCLHKSRLTRICQHRCKKHYCPRFYLDYKVEKLSARELLVNDYLLYPINQEIRDLKFINLNHYYTRAPGKRGIKIQDIPVKIKLENKFLKLLGYYIAEGSNHRAYIRFSLGNHEEEFAKEIQKLIKNLFGINANIYRRNTGKKTGIEITACNSKLSNVFENLCGKGAINKHIPFDLQNLPVKKQRIIVNAILRGDGFIGKVAKTKTNRDFKAIVTISPTLVYQIRDVLLRNKIAPTISITVAKTDKKGTYHRKAFKISWQEKHALNFSDFLVHNNVLYWISPIREIKKRQFKGNVYNLTVAKDHSFTTPNFVVGNCGAGGDIFTFVMQIEGIEFGDALKILAQKAGVELKKQDPRLSTERKRLYDICELATKFFEKHLTETKTGKEIIQYLLNRGLTKESIKEWRIGYSPDSWQGLSDFLQKSGFSIQEIEKAGLLIRNENGKSYDRFRGRIMFPVFDLNSQPVGFGGRVFGSQEEESVAKYINIVNTPIYDKSRILYGLDKAKVEIRKSDSFILVEGYTDAIMAHQAGAKNVVAVSGTALTPFHLNILKRYSFNLFSCFDMDVAGDSATKRGIDLAQKEGFNIKIITLPEGKDPAEAIAKDQNVFKDSISNAKSILDFYFESAFKKYDKTKPEGKKIISQILLPVVKRIPNKIETAHWVDVLAKELNVPKRAVEEELAKYKEEKALETAEEHKCEPKIQTRQEKLQERIICLILQWPKLLKELKKEVKEHFSADFLAILKKLEETEPKEWEKIVFEDNLNNIFNDVFLQAKTDENLINQTEKEAKEEILSSINDFFNLSVKIKLLIISQEVKKLELENDTEKDIKKLMEEYNKLSKKLIDAN